jgi:flagellar biosynthesis/type III secretory pathway protein FliH
VTVYLSPADHETLTAHPPVDYPGRTITLEADPALVSGDAVAVSGVTRVDARLSEAIARVRAVLST